MRTLALCLTLASPATAWDFASTPLCMVSNGDRDVDVIVAYNPGTALYAIHLTLDQPWPAGPVFSLAFEGPRGLTISTDRHVLSDDGRTLTVTDSGFGNVLDGMQFNTTTVAAVAGQTFAFSLDGAADPIARFRDCGAALTG